MNWTKSQIQGHTYPLRVNKIKTTAKTI